jgi:hypothetical protein
MQRGVARCTPTVAGRGGVRLSVRYRWLKLCRHPWRGPFHAGAVNSGAYRAHQCRAQLSCDVVVASTGGCVRSCLGQTLAMVETARGCGQRLVKHPHDGLTTHPCSINQCCTILAVSSGSMLRPLKQKAHNGLMATEGSLHECFTIPGVGTSRVVLRKLKQESQD